MFQILRMGCNSLHDNNFSVNRPNGYQWGLLLLVKSNAVFIIDKEDISVPANTLIIFDQNQPHEYRANGEAYKNDWIHVELNPAILTQYPIPLNTPLYLSNPYYISDLIQRMANEFFSNNQYKEQTIDSLMQLLFIKTKEQLETKTCQTKHSRTHDDLVRLRSEIYSNPYKNWSIPLMADMLHISCGHLQNIYKDTFNISCMSEVIESRITYAKELLINTDLPVGEVASMSGYQNEVHFMRQFKTITTLTPTQYRRLNRKQS